MFGNNKPHPQNLCHKVCIHFNDRILHYSSGCMWADPGFSLRGGGGNGGVHLAATFPETLSFDAFWVKNCPMHITGRRWV